MQEKKVHKLIIDKQFQNLIPPLKQDEFKQLEENIKQCGCREPICVFKNTIIDGHNRYNICIKHNIPFDIQELEFNSREEIIIWICANQLGRRNVSLETKKYLIGKRYEAEKIVQNCKNKDGNNQYINQLLPNESKFRGKNKTAKRLGDEYKISQNTVKVYSRFAKSIDYLSSEDSDFCEQVMKGQVKLTQQDVTDILSHLPSKLNAVKQRAVADTSRKKQPKKVTVKDMPNYDPDGEIMSLVYTIPSWIGSMERILNKQDINISTKEARQKLNNELQNLKYMADTLILAMEVENG